MTCQDFDILITALALGESVEDDPHAAKLHEHLAGCAACREKLADLRITASLLHQAAATPGVLPQPTLSPERRIALRAAIAADSTPHRPLIFRLPYRPIGIAAALGLIAFAGFEILSPINSASRPATEVALTPTTTTDTHYDTRAGWNYRADGKSADDDRFGFAEANGRFRPGHDGDGHNRTDSKPDTAPPVAGPGGTHGNFLSHRSAGDDAERRSITKSGSGSLTLNDGTASNSKDGATLDAAANRAKEGDSTVTLSGQNTYPDSSIALGGSFRPTTPPPAKSAVDPATVAIAPDASRIYDRESGEQTSLGADITLRGPAAPQAKTGAITDPGKLQTESESKFDSNVAPGKFERGNALKTDSVGGKRERSEIASNSGRSDDDRRPGEGRGDGKGKGEDPSGGRGQPSEPSETRDYLARANREPAPAPVVVELAKKADEPSSRYAQSSDKRRELDREAAQAQSLHKEGKNLEKVEEQAAAKAPAKPATRVAGTPAPAPKYPPHPLQADLDFDEKTDGPLEKLPLELPNPSFAGTPKAVPPGYTAVEIPTPPAAPPVTNPAPASGLGLEAQRAEVEELRKKRLETSNGTITASRSVTVDKSLRQALLTTGEESSLAKSKAPADLLKDVKESDPKAATTLEKPSADQITTENRELAKLAEAKKEIAGQAEPDAALPAAAMFKALPVNPFVMTASDKFSTFGLDTDTASYSLARRYIRSGFLPPVGAIRTEEFVNTFDYNYENKSAGTFALHAEAAPHPFREAGANLTLLKVGVKARTVGREGRKPAHLVFVIDASGSMDKPDRLPLVQYAVKSLAAQLNPRDRVTIITYNTHAHLLLEAAPASEPQKLASAVEQIQTSGTTNLVEGLTLGYDLARRHFESGAINRVILCSDGVANIGESDAQAILGRISGHRKDGITLTAAGFGLGAYNDAVMQQLADKGDGNYVFIDSKDEAKRVFVTNMAATLQTVAKDAKIQVEFDPAVVRRYRLLGYEKRDIADKDFRNDAIDAGEIGSGQSATALYEIEFQDPAAIHGVNPPDLGAVHVRWKEIDGGKVQEISYRMAGSMVRPRSVSESPRMHLAASAAQFSELLRKSPYSRGVELPAIERVMTNVAQQLPLDKQAAELLDLIRTAKGLPAAP